MSMIQDDGTGWSGPGFDFDAPKGNWPTGTSKPIPVTEELNAAIQSTLKRAKWELLEEDGTGEYSNVGANNDEEDSNG